MFDVLRASSTICAALDAGADGVVPCLEPEDARRVAADAGSGMCITGGERKGVRIDGFDLGNSPLEYTRERVGGRRVAFTTTNGTRALLRAAESADRVLIGALMNLGALVEALLRDGRDVHLICAGTNGLVSLEDLIGAGAVAAALRASGVEFGRDDAVRALVTLYESRREDLVAALYDGIGGRNLRRLGYDADVEFCARESVLSVVPEFVVGEMAVRDGRERA